MVDDRDRGNPADGMGGVDPATMRRILVHEARVHATPGRRLRDLGDSLLLHDPLDPEPFWNRLRNKEQDGDEPQDEPGDEPQELDEPGEYVTSPLPPDTGTGFGTDSPELMLAAGVIGAAMATALGGAMLMPARRRR